MALDQSLPEFELLRQRQRQQNQNDMQSADDAIKRRFASQGGLNTGAFIKMQEMGQDKIRQQGEQAEQNIGFQEAQVKRGLEETQKARDFQSGEAKIAREFGAGEAQKGRDFQKQISDQDMNFKNAVFKFESSSKLRELDLADKQFALDKETTEFNKRLAQMEYESGQAGLFGQGGFLGLGKNPLDLLGGGKGGGGALGGVLGGGLNPFGAIGNIASGGKK